MRHLTKIVTIVSTILFSVFFFSCEQPKKNEPTAITAQEGNILIDSVVNIGNKTTTISTDIEKLGNLLDFKITNQLKLNLNTYTLTIQDKMND